MRDGMIQRLCLTIGDRSNINTPVARFQYDGGGFLEIIMNDNDIATIIEIIDRITMIDLPFKSILNPLYDILKQSGRMLIEQEDKIRKMKEERDIAQQLLVQNDHRDYNGD
jgi:hypothetical protein